MNDETTQQDHSRTLGQIVSERRTQLGWTQHELAERVGMSQEWVTKIETGRIKSPKLQSLKRLASELRIEVESLVIASGFAQSTRGARQVVEQTPEYDAELPPHLRASFLRVGELSPTGQKKLASFLDDLFALEGFQNTKNARDT